MKIESCNYYKGNIGTCRRKRGNYEISIEVHLFIRGVSRGIYEKGGGSY